jgi:predicted TIM-barrel fold metal-dependent hydrolase
MRVDVQAYLGHWPFRSLRGNNCESLLAAMDRHAVDLAAVGNLNGLFYKNCQSANEELHEMLRAQRAYSARFIPMAVINPSYPGWKEDLKVCRDRFGMKGVRVYPQYHDYELDHPALVELVKTARDWGMPIAFTCRMVDTRQRSWLDSQRELYVERRRPDMDQFNLDDFAGVIKQASDAKYLTYQTFIGAETAATEEVLKRADVVFDTVRASGVPIAGPNGYGFLGAVKKYGGERFAFGTATPFVDYISPFLRVYTLKEADASTKSMIWGGNAKRIFGL